MRVDKRFIFVGFFLIGGSLLGFYLSDMNLPHYLYWEYFERTHIAVTHVFSYSLSILGAVILLRGLGLKIPLPGANFDIRALTDAKNDFFWAWLLGFGIFGIVLSGVIYYIFNYL